MATNLCKKCGKEILCETGKSKKIIHYLDDGFYYRCNHACSVSMSKTTRDISKVTCKNCMKTLSGIEQ